MVLQLGSDSGCLQSGNKYSHLPLRHNNPVLNLEELGTNRTIVY